MIFCDSMIPINFATKMIVTAFFNNFDVKCHDVWLSPITINLRVLQATFTIFVISSLYAHSNNFDIVVYLQPREISEKFVFCVGKCFQL